MRACKMQVTVVKSILTEGRKNIGGGGLLTEDAKLVVGSIVGSGGFLPKKGSDHVLSDSRKFAH